MHRSLQGIDNHTRKGFQTRYSTEPGASSPLVAVALEGTEIRFSPYTDSPGVRFLVTSRSSLPPRATKTPACLWGSMMTLLWSC